MVGAARPWIAVRGGNARERVQDALHCASGGHVEITCEVFVSRVVSWVCAAAGAVRTRGSRLG